MRGWRGVGGLKLGLSDVGVAEELSRECRWWLSYDYFMWHLDG